MKSILIGCMCLIIAFSTSAQMVDDTVSINAGYTNQTWYSLASGTLQSNAKTEWDLAFEISGITSSIRTNSVNGNKLYVYPSGDTGSWNNIDTTGIGSWSESLNSDTSWAWGAFNVNTNVSDPNDLGWGVYNITTHHVTGDSIYIINHGGDFKKLWMVSLASGTYTFRIADLDGSSEIERTLAKGDFPDKNFGYYSIDTDQNLNREPIAYNWDLLFTQYPALIPGFGSYPSTGVLLNRGVQAAQVYPVDDAETYEDYSSASFSTEMNSIGYRWKSYNFGTNGWDIADSTVYFIKDYNANVWKVVMRDFGGSTDGNYMFSKEMVGSAPVDTTDTTTGINVVETETFINIYPNPTTNQAVTVVYDLGNADGAEMTISNLNGSIIDKRMLIGSGLRTESINLGGISSGIYLVNVRNAHSSTVEKLIVR